MSKTFGETIRELRLAQDLGLRQTAGMLQISPAYLSRIERNKETPPKADVIKSMAKIFATDPDILFRLSSSTDPEIENVLRAKPPLLKLLRKIIQADLKEKEFLEVEKFIENIREKDSVLSAKV